MDPLTIRIQDKKDKDKVLFPEFKGKPLLFHGSFEAVSILEGGMKSGRASIGFLVGTEKGTIVMEMSPDQLETIYSAYQGATQRWGQ